MTRITVLFALLPGLAFAQESPGFDGHRLRIAALDGDLRDPLSLERPARMRAGDWFLSSLLSASDGSLSRWTPTGSGATEVPLLDDVLGLNLAVGGSPHERIRLDASMPFALSSLGPDRVPNGFATGDLRLSALVGLVLPDDEDLGFGLGVAVHLDTPTGVSAAYLGAGKVAGGGELAASYAAGRFTGTANLGLQFHPKVDASTYGGSDAVTSGLALSALVHASTALGLESHIEIPFSDRVSAETLFTVRHRRSSGAFVLAGAGVGLLPGVGTARGRLFLGMGFGGHSEARRDADGDGLIGAADLCPAEPETVNAYADDDGCPDALSELEVLVTRDDRRIAGAEVEVRRSGAPPITVTSADQPQRLTGLTPQTAYIATATEGACWASSVSFTLEPGTVGELAVELLPVRDALLQLSVVDGNGQPIDDALAQIRDPAPGCAPSGKHPLTAGAAKDVPVAAGSHELLFTAPGHAPWRTTVDTLTDGPTPVVATLQPTRVDVRASEIRILEKVYFVSGSTEISTSSHALLDEVADILLTQDIGTVEIQGHTDDKGSRSANLALSQRRAATVEAYLVARGVSAERLTAKGYGESKPIASNRSSRGRSVNRRVVFLIR